MNWEDAHQMIISKIEKNLNINTERSSFRVILEIPPYKCGKYKDCAGFKVKIGKSENSWIEIPITMLKELYESARDNENMYNNSVFVYFYAQQQRVHPCHVHVVGQIFVKAELATVCEPRNYKLL